MKIHNKPQLKIDAELINICVDIKFKNKSVEEWSASQSLELFKSEKYCGGYDEIVQTFVFTYFNLNGEEWWFEITIDMLDSIIKSDLQYLDLHKPL